MIRGIIVGHYDFAMAMLTTVEHIIGKQSDVEVISNRGLSCDALTKKIADIVARGDPAQTIVFLDLPGGSCTISCYNLLKNEANQILNIISGVNLPILIEFFMLRDKHSVNELVPILMEKGKDNIIQLRCRNG
jgi:PTS system mannose-specific IIA component